MELAEKDTIIIVNQADRAEGYFRFHTTYKPDWRRFINRVGRNNVEVVRESTEESLYFEAEAHAPYRYYSSTNFGIKIPAGYRATERRKLTDAQAKALQKAREARQQRRAS